MFTNRDTSEKFDKQILKDIKNFKSLEIATGYFGTEIIEKFEKDLIEISRKGYCKILIGMIFHGGVNKKQKQTLENINKKLRKINGESGIFILREDYHGKIYKFKNDEDEIIYIGSSNFSNEGLNKRLECNIPIIDKESKKKVSNYVDFLFNHEKTSKLDDVELKLKKKKRKVIKKTLNNYKRPSNLYPKEIPISETRISLRPNNQPRSSLNLCFDKGRKVEKNGKVKWVPRNWYEVEITTQKKEQTKDYPRGEFKAWTKDNGNVYELDMITSGGDVPGKNIKGYKDIMTREREVLGELIKGKLQREGYLEENDPVTLETLQNYGREYISFKKIRDKVYYLEF